MSHLVHSWLSCTPVQPIPCISQRPALARALNNSSSAHFGLSRTFMRSLMAPENVRDHFRCRFPSSLSGSSTCVLQHPAQARTFRNSSLIYPRQRPTVEQNFVARGDMRDPLRRRPPSGPSGSSLAFPGVLRPIAAFAAVL